MALEVDWRLLYHYVAEEIVSGGWRVATLAQDKTPLTLNS